MNRVAVFIDYQNVYNGARRNLGMEHEPHWYGQVSPRRVGLLLTDRGRAVDPSRELESVHIFRGEPSAKHNEKGQAACQRQVRYWSAQERVVPVTRPLKYYNAGRTRTGDVTWEPREKGIDVLIALAMVTGAMKDDFDTAVLFSRDTDLAPAVEQVVRLGKRCEVAAWEGRSRLSVPGHKIWCHWLTKQDYLGFLADHTDYTRPQPEGPDTTAASDEKS